MIKMMVSYLRTFCEIPSGKYTKQNPKYHAKDHRLDKKSEHRQYGLNGKYTDNKKGTIKEKSTEYHIFMRASFLNNKINISPNWNFPNNRSFDMCSDEGK